MSDIVKPLLYSVDLSKTLDKTDLHTLFVMGDSQAHRFELEILSGSKAVDLTGATVTGYFTNFKEDTTVTVPGKVEGGKAVVVLSKPCYTLHGQFVLTIQVKSGEVEDTVFLGEGFMRRTKGETIIYDDYIVYDVSTLLAQISAMKTATENANKATTDANEAADRANNAAGDAEDAVKAVEGWENAEATVEMLTPGSAPVVNVETAADGHRIIKMQLPMGETGLTPKITFQVETGAPGTDVQISQSGTAENPVIKLTIPRGDTGTVDGIDYYEGTPKALGTASPGTANGLARGDHVHPMPTAADVGALPAGGTAVNATQLNGKNADQYALKTDLPTKASDVGALPSGGTATDSYKLDGKDSVYYHKKFSHPRNLLDNSDFRNPVNRRGQTSYIGSGYTIDRWYLWSESGVASVSLEDGHVALNPESDSVVSLAQRFVKGYLSEEKAYTIAYLDTTGKIHIGNNPVIFTEGYDYIQIVSDVWIGVLWAALYEGSYTAETLPPYVPKGYGVELAECQRYYLNGVGRGATAVYISINNMVGISVPIPVKMRATPTVTIKNLGNIVAKEWVGGINSVSSVELYNNSVYVVCETSSSAGNWATGFSYDISFDLSADL